MFNKLKPGDSEEDILRMANEFEAERQKNPNFKPAANLVRVEKSPKNTFLAQNHDKTEIQDESGGTTETVTPKAEASNPTVNSSVDITPNQNDVLLTEIQENILGDTTGKKFDPKRINKVLGEIVERRGAQKMQSCIMTSSERGKSIFAQKFLAEKNQPTPEESRDEVVQQEKSSIIEDATLAKELHNENIRVLNQMSEEDILAERANLLKSLDPQLVNMLTKKRESQNAKSQDFAVPMEPLRTSEPSASTVLVDSSLVHDLYKESSEKNWLNFDIIEEDKLAWMRDIPAKAAKLNPGEQFNARFDWKGVLLPHTVENLPESLDERELYLHGEEPERPGYTLQELFRLARSTVSQQRISAIGAIGCIFNIYNQGFYDQVLDLPISKTFFLLRFALDDNTHAQLEVTTKALAALFYNEADEALLDYVHENAYCHWQPTLSVIANASDEDDPSSIAFLQRQMKLLRSNPTAVRAEVEEEVEERTSMDDFQLAETDLIDGFLRTNILRRITFILCSLRPENNIVDSCLKLLIRIARTSQKGAQQVVNEPQLLQMLKSKFMPNIYDLSVHGETQKYYGYPQHLCLKLFRVLIGQHLNIAKLITDTAFIETLQNYLFYQGDIKGKMIIVQIEALRILRCLLIHGVIDRELFRQFLSALRQMVDWHYKHCVFEVGGPGLIRQHAAAVLAAVVASGESGACSVEVQKLLMEPLHNCFCSWMHKATKGGALQDYTQLTLLSAMMYTVSWFARHSYDGGIFYRFLSTYLPNFVRSECFIACVQQMITSSIILRQFSDRRNVHNPLPNVGAVLMNEHGPQLALTNIYPVQLLSSIWALLELQPYGAQNELFKAIVQPAVLEPLGEYLKRLSSHFNRFLATNFFARTELKFIFQLLCTDGLETYLNRTQLLQLVYNYLCCLSSSHAMQMKTIFERFIFNSKYIQLDFDSLALLQQACMEIVYPHFIQANREPTLTLCYTQPPILPSDWPYLQLRILLADYVKNVHQEPAVIYSENQLVRMTLSFVQQLEENGLQVVEPLEKLMYLMITFMGPNSEFLEPKLNEFLSEHIRRFYAQYATYKFDLDKSYRDKSNFEPLFYLFVEQFQAVSYGDELFASLVMLPLAQKYNNKWRRRMWSEHVDVLRFLQCDESLLIGGLNAYLEPVEDEPSLVKLYGDAIYRQLVRPGTMSYNIARHHFNNSQVVQKPNSF